MVHWKSEWIYIYHNLKCMEHSHQYSKKDKGNYHTKISSRDYNNMRLVTNLMDAIGYQEMNFF